MQTYRTPRTTDTRQPLEAAPPSSPVSVLLVDDHPGIRDALHFILDHDPAFTICGIAASAPEALQMAKTFRPCIAVLDVSLQEGDGLELAQLLRLLDPELAIVFFTLNDHPATVRRAIQLGALGFVAKSEPLQNLLQAIHLAGKGQVYLNEHLSQQLEAWSPPPGPVASSDIECFCRPSEEPSSPSRDGAIAPLSASQRQQLARKWGFPSYVDMETFLRNDSTA